MNFNFLFKTGAWQSVLAADVDAAIKRGTTSAGEARRISLIDCEATLDHMLLSIGARGGGRPSRMKHLITGASARFSLRAAPDIRLNAGVSNFWQRRREAQAGTPVTRGSAERAGAGEETADNA